MKEVLDRAIAQLPPSYRDVYELRDIEDLSGEEVARRLAITPAVMKSRLHRARALLREHLDQALAH